MSVQFEIVLDELGRVKLEIPKAPGPEKTDFLAIIERSGINLFDFGGSISPLADEKAIQYFSLCVSEREAVDLMQKCRLLWKSLSHQNYHAKPIIWVVKSGFRLIDFVDAHEFEVADEKLLPILSGLEPTRASIIFAIPSRCKSKTVEHALAINAYIKTRFALPENFLTTLGDINLIYLLASQWGSSFEKYRSATAYQNGCICLEHYTNQDRFSMCYLQNTFSITGASQEDAEISWFALGVFDPNQISMPKMVIRTAPTKPKNKIITAEEKYISYLSQASANFPEYIGLPPYNPFKK